MFIIIIFIIIVLVNDSLCLYVGLEDGGLMFGLVGASCDGAFGKGWVHVCPFGKFLEFVDMGLQVLNVVCE